LQTNLRLLPAGSYRQEMGSWSSAADRVWSLLWRTIEMVA